jgi:hypothetical protein
MLPSARAFVFSLVVSVLVCSGAGRAQAGPDGESAAAVYRRTLTQEGRVAAAAKFHEMSSDTSGAYAFDPRELLVLATRLYPAEGKRQEGLDLLKLLDEAYPETAELKYRLGLACVDIGEADEARRNLERTMELDSTRTHIRWMLDRLDERIETSRLGREYAETYAPGANLGIQGHYLGQQPPGDVPKVFAPGVLSTHLHEYSIAISPDGREIYFSRSGQGTLISRWGEAGWTAPRVLPLFGDSLECEEASVAPGGKQIFFNARGGLRRERVICRAERIGDGWGNPRKLFPGMYATSSLDGSVYYTVTAGRPDYGVIGMVEPSEMGYTETEVLAGGINSDRIDAHPCIAPDESMILFDSDRDRRYCIYVAYREADGSWGAPICLADHIPLPGLAGQAALSPDGRYLFFSYEGDMYWVSARILKELGPG